MQAAAPPSGNCASRKSCGSRHVQTCCSHVLVHGEWRLLTCISLFRNSMILLLRQFTLTSWTPV